MKMESVFLEITWFYLNASEVLKRPVLVAYGVSPRLDQKSFLCCTRNKYFQRL